MASFLTEKSVWSFISQRPFISIKSSLVTVAFEEEEEHTQEVGTNQSPTFVFPINYVVTSSRAESLFRPHICPSFDHALTYALEQSRKDTGTDTISPSPNTDEEEIHPWITIE